MLKKTKYFLKNVICKIHNNFDKKKENGELEMFEKQKQQRLTFIKKCREILDVKLKNVNEDKCR